MDLFSEEKRHFNLPNAELIYIENFYDTVKADYYFELLKTTIDWRHDDIKMFGKTYKKSEIYKIMRQPHVISILKPGMGNKPSLHYLGLRREVV